MKISSLEYLQWKAFSLSLRNWDFMRETHTFPSSEDSKMVEWCPVCGQNLDITEGVNACPTCGFELQLITTPEMSPTPAKTSAPTPRLANVLLILQGILAMLLGVAFLFFANPLYFGIPLIFASIQFSSVGILPLFLLLIKMRPTSLILRVAITVLGILTLPIGGLTITAAISLAAPPKYCTICRKQIGWTISYEECPHCSTLMHRWGRCLEIRRQRLTTSLGREPMDVEMQIICPICCKPINPNPGGRR